MGASRVTEAGHLVAESQFPLGASFSNDLVTLNLFCASGIQKNTPGWLPFKHSPGEKDDHKVLRRVGDMVRTVGARCDRRPASNSQVDRTLA